MSGYVDLLDGLRNEIRNRGQSVTAFRLGTLVGLRGVDVPCPYNTPRSAKLYREGIEFGQRRRTANGGAP